MYEIVVLSQIKYCSSAWYILSNKVGHRKYVLSDLETIQAVAARVITRAFKAMSRLALDVELFLLPIKH